MLASASVSETGLAATSSQLFVAAVLTYTVAMLAFAVDFALTRRARRVALPVQEAPAREAVLVGAGAPLSDQPAVRPPTMAPAAGGAASPPETRRGRWFGRGAVAVTVVAWLVHLSEVVTRGVAAGRVPWGNMYEFSSAVALVAVGVYLVLLTRHPVRWLGLYVLMPVVLYLGLAGTVLFVAPGPLVPALNSYWIKIHVVAAILATGTFMVGGVVSLLQLSRRRYDSHARDQRPLRFGRFAGRLPATASLERTEYRLIAFAFPIWTFAIVAGAIWAEAAWGRYWGWDPKETWSFITWVVYAAYLHARSTPSMRHRAPLIALLGFGALIVNYYVVNTVVVGLHSYAGI